MKETDLMIGDWVYLYVPDEDGKEKRYTGKVFAISEYDNLGLNGDCNFMYKVEHCDEDYFESAKPIPLTTEILEKNGWEDKNNISNCLGIEVFANEKKLCGVEFCADNEYSFNTYERWEETDYDGAPTNWGYRYINTIYRLHYVHELQHALRLCGLDDLADNIQI